MAHLAPTRRPLRLLAAMMLLALASLAPIVSASADAPRTFGVVGLLQGDEWTYAVTRLNETAEGFEPWDDGSPFLAQRTFTQGSGGGTWDRDGRFVDIAKLAEHQVWMEGQEATAEDVAYLVAPEGSTVRSLRTHEGADSSSTNSITGVPGNLSVFESERQYPLFYTTRWAEEPFCGHRSSLQAETRTLSRGVQVSGCDGATEFIPVATVAFQEEEAVVVGWDEDPEALQLWFVEDRPVPIRIFDARTEPASVHELVAFTAGNAPLAHGGEGGPDLTPLDVAAREDFGPVEIGVDHPFPLSVAYAAALAEDSPGIAAFLASHPDAYLASASFQDVRDEKHTHVEHRRAWTLVVTDGKDAAATRVTHTTIERENDVTPVALPPLPPTVESVSPGSGPWPAAAAVPATWPTVASVLERARQAELAATPGNAWGFAVACEADCQTASVQLWAGEDRTYIPNELKVGTAIASGPQRDAQLVAVDAEGRMVWAQTATWTREHQLVVGPIEIGDAPSDVQPVAVGGSGTDGIQVPWTGVAIAGAAIGLAVVMAVLAKLGLFGGLFSRHIEDVSAHPVRRTLLEAIRAQPGIHFSELLRRTGKGNSVVGHHLRRLVASNLVVAKQGPRFQCYFPAGTSRATLAAGPLLKSPVAQGILSAAAAHPIAGQELAAKLGVAPGAISFHAHRLTEAGLLTSRRQGRYVYLEATAAGKESVSES